MARNASGTYALPAGNPVVTATVIQSSWANTTLADLASEMTDSLDRSGKGGMLAPLLNVNGTALLPAVAFNLEPSTGMFRPAASQLGFSVAGVQAVQLSANGVAAPMQLFTSPQAAAGTQDDFRFVSTVTRTAGLLFNLMNNAQARAQVTAGGGVFVTSELAAGGGGTDFFFQSVQSRTTGTLFGVANNGVTRVSLSNTGNNTFAGQLAAADTGTDHVFTVVNTRTAGKLFDFQNNGTTVLNITHGAAVANDVMTFGGATLNFSASAAIVFSGATGTITFNDAASATIQSSAANIGLVIQGNKNAADAGTDVRLNSVATRTAGNLVDFANNGTQKAVVGFNGVVLAPNTMQVTELTTDQTNATVTMANAGNLSFPVAANADYYAEFNLLANDTATAILNVQLTGPAAPTKALMGARGIFGTTVSGFGAAAFSTPFQLMPANITTQASATIRLHLRNGANAGTVQLQFASNTAAQTVTIFAGSCVRWQRMDNAGFN